MMVVFVMIMVVIMGMVIMASGELLHGHVGDRERTCHRPRRRNADPFASVGGDVGDHRVSAGAERPKAEVCHLANPWKCD